jgi:hypothetical protein
MGGINLEYKPKTYFGPQSLLKYRIEQVKGAVVREKLGMLLNEGRIRELETLLDSEDISTASIKSLGSMHPMFMGGNYLPDMDDGEVEVARIEIASTTYDVTCLFAKMENGKISYRIVDEYDGDTLSWPRQTTTDDPMTLKEMTDFFLQAWPLMDVLEMNFEGELEPSLDFFIAKSKFYPDFDGLCRERVTDAFPEPEIVDEGEF